MDITDYVRRLESAVPRAAAAMLEINYQDSISRKPVYSVMTALPSDTSDQNICLTREGVFAVETYGWWRTPSSQQQLRTAKQLITYVVETAGKKAYPISTSKLEWILKCLVGEIEVLPQLLPLLKQQAQGGGIGISGRIKELLASRI